MKNLILFDDEIRGHLLPLTFTRPACELRVGILTIREKWERFLKGRASYITQEYLSGRYPIRIEKDNLLINGTYLPNQRLVKLIAELGMNESLVLDGDLIAVRLEKGEFSKLAEGVFQDEISGYTLTQTQVARISRLWDLLNQNENALKADFSILTKNRRSEPLPSSCRLIGEKRALFIEPGAEVLDATFNTTEGPVYVGKDAIIMEGSCIRGPVAICDNAKVHMGAKIYGPTTIGPYCKVGGEVKRTIMQAHSNKAHDGFLGDSVIGKWCNIGADANTSNLKNNYGEVRLWDYQTERFEHSGRQFLGLFMGDHSKCGINTMFNTGTVVGVFANIFGAGFPRNFIPSFSWGGHHGFQSYRIDKALETAARVVARRGLSLDEVDKQILSDISEMTSKYRHWEQ